ncbi:MAG: iron-containing alcohol dehydrogenase [Lachnospiraceae bacterium]|nr:iron-containing alcohol dehydrogenase [Lachnospiraceae bacterium]
MSSYVFQPPGRIYCGADTVEIVADCCRELKGKRIFVITGRHVSKIPYFAEIMETLASKQIVCRTYISPQAEPTVEGVDALSEAVREEACDIVMAIGGGSIIDQAKAAAMLATNEGSIREYLFGGSKSVENPPVPVIAIPTTAGSGSEVTAAAVIEDEARQVKLSVTNRLLIPQMVIVDTKLHREMPFSVTVSTGMDALTHAIEAYTSKRANPFSDMYAKEAITLIAHNLPVAAQNPDQLEARRNMEIASMMAAAAFANGGLGAVHGISQAVGGLLPIPHGLANALLLPHVMEMNIPGCPERYAEIGKLLGSTRHGAEAAEDAVTIVKQWLKDYEMEKGLGQLGLTEEMVPRIVRETMAYRLLDCNPVPVTEDKVKYILDKAW